MARLVKEGWMIAPPEVRAEIEKKDDDLLRWVRRQRRMFVDLSEAHLRLVKDILRQFPRLIHPEKATPEADPFVVALALAAKRGELFGGDHVVVTQENPNPRGRPNIPDVCRHYGIEWMDVSGIFAREGWRF